MRRLLKGTLYVLTVPVLTAGAIIGALYAFETYVSKSDPDYADLWWKYPQRPIPISNAPIATIAGEVIGGVQGNLDYTGTAPWETRGRVPESRVFHIRSNKFGFYTDYPIDNFPQKQTKEFRIILVGGSGAQGHGGSSNDRMMYKLLERNLATSLADLGVRITLINLALAGHESRRNFATLRAFGHALEPDMILAYNGANDISQFTNAYFGDSCGSYLARELRSTFIQPDWVRDIGAKLPALFYKYGLANWIKTTFYGEEYRKIAEADCLRDLGVDTSRDRTMTAVYRDATRRIFVAYLKAIKRDFCGIPITLAWQAVQDGERTLYDRWMNNFDPELNPVATLDSINSNEIQISFYNPERRVVHFLTRPSTAPPPTWDEIIQTSPGYAKPDGYIHIPNRASFQNAVTISARSSAGFNINRNAGKSISIRYVVLQASPADTPPSPDFIEKNGKALTSSSDVYNIDPAKTEGGTSPTVYFIVTESGHTSPAFKAPEHEDAKGQPDPAIYYALAPAGGDRSTQVYRAHKIGKLNEFRREKGVYQKFFEYSMRNMKGYLNDDWYFINADRIASSVDRSKVPEMTDTSIAVHMDDVGQQVMADILNRDLAPIVRNLINRPNRPACPSERPMSDGVVSNPPAVNRQSDEKLRSLLQAGSHENLETPGTSQ